MKVQNNLQLKIAIIFGMRKETKVILKIKMCIYNEVENFLYLL